MNTFDEINDNLSDTNIAKQITTLVDCEYMFIPSSYTGSFEQFLNEYREHYSDIPSIGGGIFTEPEEDPFKYKLDIIQKVVDVDIRKSNNPDNPESWTFGGQILHEVTGDGNSWSGQITGLPDFGYKDVSQRWKG